MFTKRLLFSKMYNMIYTFMYHMNVCCHYILSYDLSMMLSLYIFSYNMINEKYTFMYKRNVCCYYILSYTIKNKYFYYISSCIIKKCIFICERNICCYYTSSRIMRNTLSYIITIFIYYYIRKYIMTTNISVVHLVY